MTQAGWVDRARPSRLGAVVAFVVALALGSSAASAAEEPFVVDLEKVVAAILGTQQFTTQQLDALDLNGDGTVDAADISYYFTPTFNEVNFAASTTAASEGTGISIVVRFNRPTACTLGYTIGGTATTTTNAHSIVVPGTKQVSIPLPIADDEAMSLDDKGQVHPEETELVWLSLAANPTCYRIGPVSRHTVMIDDNDAIWFASLDSTDADRSLLGGRLGLRLQVVTNGATRTARLLSDGSGGLPQGSFPAQVISFGATEVHVRIDPDPPILVPTEATGFGIAFRRSFELHATSPDPKNPKITDSLIRGAFTETITPMDQALRYLETNAQGACTLVREPARPSSWEPTLADKPQVGGQ